MRWTAVLVAVVVVAASCATPEVGPRQEMRIPLEDEAFEITIVDRVNENGAVASAWYVDPYTVLGDSLNDIDIDLGGSGEVAVWRDQFGYDAVAVYTTWPNCEWAPEIRVDDDGDTIRLGLRSFGDCGGDQDSMAFVRTVGFFFSEDVEPATVLASHEMVS
jgi:hypothetical protein